MPKATAVADNALALELKIDLSKQGSARFLRCLGKRTGGGATDKRELGDSLRDLGSLSPTQTAMGARATSERAAQSVQTRTGPSSPVAGFTRNGSPETTQLGRLGAAAFSDRVRPVAPLHGSAYRVNGLPFAAPRPAHGARTRNHATSLRRAKQPGDRRRGGLEFIDGEKASSRRFPQTRSDQPQSAHGVDAINRPTADYADFADCWTKRNRESDFWIFLLHPSNFCLPICSRSSTDRTDVS